MQFHIQTSIQDFQTVCIESLARSKKVNSFMQPGGKKAFAYGSTRVRYSPKTPCAVSMVLHPFCARIIFGLSLLVEAHQQLPPRRLAVDVVIIQYVLQSTWLCAMLRSLYSMHVHNCTKHGRVTQMQDKGP